MKNITQEFREHLDGDVVTVAYIWTVTPVGGSSVYLTSHDQDIEFEGNTYKSGVGFTATTIENETGFSVDNSEVTGTLNSDTFTDEDVQSGKLDNAVVEIAIVNYKDTSMGKLIYRTGTFGNVVLNDITKVATTELVGLTAPYKQRIGRQYKKTCDAIFGDDRCGVDLAQYTHDFTVTTVTDNRQFEISGTGAALANGYFNFGNVKWLTGNNSGLQMEVKTTAMADVELYLGTPFPIQIGDTGQIIRGCNKTLSDCRIRLNSDRFRGFPHIPTTDTVLNYGRR